MQLSGTSLASAVGVTPKVSVASVMAGAPVVSALHQEDSETNLLMQKILSLLLRVSSPI